MLSFSSVPSTSRQLLLWLTLLAIGFCDATTGVRGWSSSEQQVVIQGGQELQKLDLDTQLSQPLRPRNDKWQGGGRRTTRGPNRELVVAESDESTYQTFSSSIAVVFEGDEDYIKTSEAVLYEDVIQLSYNNISQSLCADGTSLTIVEVYLDGAPMHERDRHLAASTAKKVKSVYTIVFQCKGCSAKSALFRNDAIKRRLNDDLDQTINSPLYVGHRHDDLDSRSLQQTNIPGQPCNLPTTGAFIQNCQTILQQFITEGRIETFMTPVTATELQPVPCGDDVVELETSILLKFMGDRTNITKDGLVQLAKTVENTVNELNTLNEALCDPLFRVVVGVNASLLDTTAGKNVTYTNATSIIVTSTNATNTNSTGTNASYPKYKYFRVLVKILFQCRSCTKGTTLFGIEDGLQPRQLHLDRRLSLASVAAVNDTCYCPIGAEERRAPTLAEFNSAFNASVMHLVAENQIHFVAAVGQASEVKEIDCTSNAEKRETQLELEATGDTEAITSYYKRSLEKVVNSSMIDVFASFCDPQGRTIVDVAFDGIRVATALDLQDRSLSSGTVQKFRILLNVKFTCRSCSEDAKLFTSGTVKRNLATTTYGSSPSVSYIGDVCLCNATEEERPPTETEVCI